MAIVTEEDVLAALHGLETSRWEEVLVFIGYLRQRGEATIAAEAGHRNGSSLTAQDLAASDLVGIWPDCTDLPDSPEYARQLRHQAEQRRHR